MQTLCLSAQEFIVSPYLQHASPTEIFILWETTFGAESIVHWGQDENLGNEATGSSQIHNGNSQIHEVHLNNLDPFTPYFYSVKTDLAVSDTFDFVTPPLANSEQGFRFTAMSDMQIDGAHPDKFREVIHDGIIDHVGERYSDDLPNHLGFVIIPGDLVQNGNNYDQWQNHFFNPGQPLFARVPVYPVPGNHENNSAFFFNYFHLPDNGTPGFEEHWWYKDYSNVRIVGLDSNGPYRIAEQLDWLDSLLNQTCQNDHIDFVFAQLHHPHLSELWTPGELDYTGEVIQLLEQFTTNCGKPSIHFFGHTHGYSRGQSRDHEHLWVNVATAGGAIDNWGEFPQFDYDEFSVSQDEWGFVMVDVEAGDDPAFTLKRISRGNETTFRDNEITDSITISLSNQSPDKPTGLFPIDESVIPECVVLKANFFEDADGIHGASHWQISTNCDDFTNPVVDRWRNHENWYFNQDLQSGDDLTDERITELAENTSYCWRVRYRDQGLKWSEWSEAQSFSTSVSNGSMNLLTNPGAESDIDGWQVVTGVLEALEDGECNGISPNSGLQYFAVGGVCQDGAFGKSVQHIDISAQADSIDNGTIQVNYGGYLSNFGGSDLPEMRLVFLDDNEIELDSTIKTSTLNSNWTKLDTWSDIPVGTRSIQFCLFGTRNTGSDNDSYFDDMFLRVGEPQSDCDEYTVSTGHIPIPQVEMQIAPNPFQDMTRISLTSHRYENLSIEITDLSGRFVQHIGRIPSRAFNFRKGDLKSGMYLVRLYQDKQLIDVKKMVVAE